MRNIVPYAACTAGSIEVMNDKLVLNVLRSQLSEMQWPVRHWPRLLAPLRHYLNTKPRQLLKNKAPIELARFPREDPLRNKGQGILCRFARMGRVRLVCLQ